MEIKVEGFEFGTAGFLNVAGPLGPDDIQGTQRDYVAEPP